MKLTIGATYSSGSALHQRRILRFRGDELDYIVVNSHCAHVIGAERSCFRKEFELWAKRQIEQQRAA